MTNLPVPIQAITSAENKFLNIAKQKNTELIWEEQAGYAKQLILHNESLFGTAQRNPQSLKDSIVNLSAVGLSLNPALSFAYLVPRDGKVCLDVSYKGLLKLATDSGAIKWAKSECVYENDTFTYKGINELPDHEANVFSDRGLIVGVYCIAKTYDNEYLVDTMSVQEINEVRDTSKSKNSKFSPWNTFYDEMAKKTIIKRASKMWPKTDRNHLQEAISIINEHEGLEAKHIESEPVKIEQFEVSQEMQDRFNHLFESENALNMYIFQDETTPEQWSILCKSFRDQKTANQKKLRDMVNDGRQQLNDCFDYWQESFANNDELGVKEIEEQLPPRGIEILNRWQKARS